MDVRDPNIKVSEKLIPYICTMKDGDTITEKVNLSLILGLFASQVVTLEKASELAGKSVWEFMEVLKKYHIPWGEYTEEEMQTDNAVIDKINLFQKQCRKNYVQTYQSIHRKLKK